MNAEAASLVLESPPRGSAAEPSSEFRVYIVELSRERKKADIRQLVKETRASIDSFRRNLAGVLEGEALSRHLQWIEPSENLPFVYISATSRLADRIRRMPEVREVLEDKSRLRLNDSVSRHAV